MICLKKKWKLIIYSVLCITICSLFGCGESDECGFCEGDTLENCPMCTGGLNEKGDECIICDGEGEYDCTAASCPFKRKN